MRPYTDSDRRVRLWEIESKVTTTDLGTEFLPLPLLLRTVALLQVAVVFAEDG
jgi:hypothetical protein